MLKLKLQALDFQAIRRVYKYRRLIRLPKRHQLLTLCYLRYKRAKALRRLPNVLVGQKYGVGRSTRKPAIHKRKFMGQKGPVMLNRSPRTQL